MKADKNMSVTNSVGLYIVIGLMLDYFLVIEKE